MKTADHPTTSRKPTGVRRREIIAAGMHILASEGSRQFTADRLARAVGITGGTIFRHFATMEEILDGIVDRVEEVIFSNFPPAAADPLEGLRLFVTARITAIAEHPEISRLLLTEGLIPSGENEQRRNRLAGLKRRSRRFVVGRLQDAHRMGLLPPDLRPDEASILVLGSIYAVGHMGMRTRSARDTRDLSERVWRMIERSLRNRE